MAKDIPLGRYRTLPVGPRTVIPDGTRVIVFGDDLGNTFTKPKRGRVLRFCPGDLLGPPAYYRIAFGYGDEAWVPPYQMVPEGGYRAGDKVRLLYDLEPVGGGVLQFVWSEHVATVTGLLPDGGIVVDQGGERPRVVASPAALRHNSPWRALWYRVFGR